MTQKYSTLVSFNERLEMRRLWTHLLSLQSIVLGNPWLLFGDFNVIANASKSSSTTQVVSNEMREFNDIMIKLSLFDHVFSSPILTWSSCQPIDFIARKLDRALVNDNWFPMFAHFSVDFLPLEVSDHSPILIQL